MSQNGKIILRNVGLSYGKENIYDNFNAVFPQGVNVILGRSGSGKTTLLNIIAGLISYSGECVSDKAAVVFSEPALAPVSVENNVRMVLKKTDCGAVDEALKLARIEDKRKAKRFDAFRRGKTARSSCAGVCKQTQGTAAGRAFRTVGLRR